jgi:hypothetical protein
MKLHGLVPNLYIHVSVSDFYIPTIGTPISLQQNMWIDRGNIQIDQRHMNKHELVIADEAAQFHFW